MKRSKLDKELLNAMSSDPDNWKWGLVYVNKKDPRLIVPKLSSLGWTFNFASTYSYITMILFVVIAIVFAKYIK
jgi:uncharacterized membrane protein